MSDDIARRVIVFTFCGVLIAVFGTLLVALFNPLVSNDDIFKMMTHAFDMVLVSLTSYLGGRASAAKN